MKSVLALLHLRPKSRLTMHSTLAACLISGDFALKDGESRTLSVQNKDGVMPRRAVREVDIEP